MTSSGNKHQHNYRLLDSFLHKNFEIFSPQQSFNKEKKEASRKKEFPKFVITLIRNKHQCDYGLIDGSFHKNFGIHINNSLREAIDIQAKTNFLIWMMSLRNKHQPHCRLTDGCYHKIFEFHVSISL